ncbi:MAG TPA: C40 family peptidase [Brumimicrobium sp.]|nr:C40 family peptidase [Brumimicrobium sp.]
MNFLSLLLLSTISWSNPVLDSTLIESDIQLECQIENNLIDSLVYNGTKLLGTLYKYSGNSAKGIDCSGLVHYMFNSLGVNVARSSRELAKLGHEIDINQIIKGDLVFFKGRNVNSKVVGHVGYVVEGEGEEMVFIHASSKGVILDRIVKNGYYDKRFLFAKRLEYDELFKFNNFN